MKKYPCLLNILPIYSANYSLSEEEEDSLLISSYKGVALDEIKQELKTILQDGEISLVEFLDMDGLEAYPAEDEEDAKNFLVERLWCVLFPKEAP
ncbi:hypothetical protein [Marinibactrum halimedae]|uniref:Uncharacterized protein n=1 Tax=Marinibactrum halimedae TaxID=1444977 RepID=A0AA37T2S3_9GAMM|nr:hypothetical protein [Marinibactrum halimedae]MCD9461269.1 hypothetical protein [Marinibactrum halimedae]GLS25904.1 hypothetical protein GCM10007877_16180 [Marinibactrum halimedae]